VALNSLSNRNWVYILEARSLSGDLGILKVGETANPYRRINNTADPLTYRSMALHEMSMGMILFEVTDAFVQQLPQDLQNVYNTAAPGQPQREVVEKALRQLLYDQGYQLPLDHTQGTWRNRPGEVLQNDRNNTVASTIGTPGKGAWQ
jgi:hypothetical protein